MKALRIEEGYQYVIKDVPVPLLLKDQVLVKVLAAALNRRDLWIGQGMYPGIRFPCTLGADCCGIVVEVENEKDWTWIGQQVVIYPSIEWGTEQEKQGPHFRVLGMPDDGTFAEFIAIDAKNLYPKPPHLSPITAAALPLAGLTAYRAASYYGNIREGFRVLITGIGGGVSQLALKICLALGSKVWVTSTKQWKIDKALNLGATGGILTTLDHWEKTLVGESGKFDVVIDSVGGDQFGQLIDMLNKGGSVVTYGASAGGPKSFNIFRLFLSHLCIKGSTMGSPRDFEEMLDLVSKKSIVPQVDSVRPFGEIMNALEDMKQGKQFGKLVVTMDTPARL